MPKLSGVPSVSARTSSPIFRGSVISVPSIESTSSPTLNAPSAGLPFETLSTLVTGVTSKPSSRSAAAVARSWDDAICTADSRSASSAVSSGP